MGEVRAQYLSFPFTIGVVLIFLMWIAGNIPNRVDVEWLKRGGGIVGHDHPPAYRFNAGQKVIYWIVVLGGTRGRGHRLCADVPVLRDRHRRHAARPDRARRRRGAVRRRDAWRTSISAPSAWRARSRRWARAPSTSIGPRSTIACGWSRKRLAPARTSRKASLRRRRPNEGEQTMRSFLLACVAAIVIATVAGFALNGIQESSDQAYSTTGVRL